MANLNYVTVGSNQLNEAKAFYDALFVTVGFKSMFEHPSGGRVYGNQGGTQMYGVLGTYDKHPATVGNGAMAGFACESREEVDAFHAKCLELGGTCDGPPGERGPGAYFAYFRDLDGNKICAYKVG